MFIRLCCYPLTCQLENLSRQVFQDGARVHGGLSTDSHVVLRSALEQTVDTSDGELLWEGVDAPLVTLPCLSSISTTATALRPTND